MKTLLTITFLFTANICFCQSLKTIDEKLSNVYQNVPNSYSDEQKSKRMDLFEKLLLKYTAREPKTIAYPFKKLVRSIGVPISTSEDGNFRIYSYDRNRMRSMPYFENVYQYRANGKVISKEIAPEIAGAPDYLYYQINDFESAGKIYYIAQRVAIGGEKDEYSIRFFSIDGDQLNPKAKLIQTKNGIAYEFKCAEVDGLSKANRFTLVFNKSDKSFSMPVVSTEGKVTNKRITYKFNGKYFVKI